MAFFELPPPPPPPPPPPEPRDERKGKPSGYFFPPDLTIGGLVPVRIELARSSDVAIFVNHLEAFAEGFSIHISTFAVPPTVEEQEEGDYSFDRDRKWDPQHGSWRRKLSAGDEIPLEVYRFGIEFADGRKVTNLDMQRPWELADEDEPRPLVLMDAGSDSNGFEMTNHYWVWPLPPTGPLAIVCEWPARGIGLSRVEIDGSLIQEAATRSEKLFEMPDGTYNVVR